MAQLDRFKIQACSWNGDTEPLQYGIWSRNFGSLVRATQYGEWLEDSLDDKLRRPKHHMLLSNVSSDILNDPDFAPASHGAASAAAIMAELRRAMASPAGDASSTASDGNNTTAAAPTVSSGSHFSLGQSRVAYCDFEFPHEARDLDSMLYNILRMNVKGTKQALLDNVTFPSYIQGMIVLDKHMNISKMDRIMAAYGTFDDLKWKGNALDFQTTVMTAKRELDLCNAGKEHYVLCKLMRAFDGKSKTIQFAIAEDFNNLTIDSTLNIHDLVQKYCSMLATVGDGVSASVNMVAEDAPAKIICHHCGVEGHKRPDCPKFKQKKLNAHKKRQNDASKKAGGGVSVTCHHCNLHGHIRPNCPDLKAGRPPHAVCLAQMEPVSKPLSADSAASAHPVAAAVASPPPPLSPYDLQQLISSLRSGSYPVRMVSSNAPNIISSP
jgi:hypothetical protein